MPYAQPRPSFLEKIKMKWTPFADGARELTKAATWREFALNGVEKMINGGVASAAGVLLTGTALYLISSQFVGTIQDDLNLKAEPPQGGSHTIEMAAKIMERELAEGWHPSDIINPARLRIDLSAHQKGVKQALESVAMTFVENVGRVGSSTKKIPISNWRDQTFSLSRPIFRFFRLTAA